MFGLAKLAVFGFVVLTIVYVCLSLYSRAARRDKLEKEWDSDGKTGDRDVFVREGLADYDGSLRRKLIWGVYIIPVAIVMALIYFMNFH